MYDSKNLPLSPKKVVKKSMGSGCAWFLLSIFLAVMLVLMFVAFHLSFWGGFLWVVVFLIVFNLFTVGSVVLYQYLYYKFYYYNFEQDSAEIKKGVISNATGHVRYGKIQNIYVDQDILDRIFGLYDVHYETAGERSGFYSHVDGLNKENSDKLVTFLNDRVSNKESSLSGGSSVEIPAQTPHTQIEDTDTRVFTRENISVSKKVVFVSTLTKALGYMLIPLVIGLRFLTDKNFDMDTFIFVLIFVLIIPTLSVIGNYIYMVIWYKNFSFKFDESGGIVTTKVFSVSNTYVYYNRIQNIDVVQSFLERIFGLYRVAIETASEGMAMKMLGVQGLNKKDAETLKDFLLEKSRKYQSV